MPFQVRVDGQRIADYIEQWQAGAACQEDPACQVFEMPFDPSENERECTDECRKAFEDVKRDFPNWSS